MHALSHQVKDAGPVRLVRTLALEARAAPRRGTEGCAGVGRWMLFICILLRLVRLRLGM